MSFFSRHKAATIALLWLIPIALLMSRIGTSKIIMLMNSTKSEITELAKNSANISNWRSQTLCKVNCKAGIPCEYKDVVDVRILVLTMDRTTSLKKCLEAISHVHTFEMKVAIDIWIDRKSKDHEDVDPNILQVARDFSQCWTGGRVCIHKREKNAYIDGQWIDTWRPKEHTKEIGLILEDDVDISPYALQWLKLVHNKYDKRKDLAGYTLQMEQTTKFYAGHKGQLIGPKGDNVFLYGVLGTWGYSPHPKRWREFQDWFHSKDTKLKPYVNGIIPTSWYKTFESRGTQRSMWEMWHIKHSNLTGLYTLYCNLHHKYSNNSIKLASNRKEKGLHYSARKSPSLIQWETMMRQWKEEFAQFPKDGKVVKLSYSGNVIEH